MGRTYVYCHALGNVNYKGGPIEIVNPEAGMEIVEGLTGQGKAVILLCACKELMSCHRYHVAQMLVECIEGMTYEEIKPPSAQLSLF